MSGSKVKEESEKRVEITSLFLMLTNILTLKIEIFT